MGQKSKYIGILKLFSYFDFQLFIRLTECPQMIDKPTLFGCLPIVGNDEMMYSISFFSVHVS